MKITFIALIIVGAIAGIIIANPNADFIDIGNRFIGENGFLHGLYEGLAVFDDVKIGVTGFFGRIQGFFNDLWNSIKDIFN